jgi:hypothetical protein
MLAATATDAECKKCFGTMSWNYLSNKHTQAFRTALDNKFQEVKVRAAPDWIDLTETMRSALEAYPVSAVSEPED